MGSFPEQRERMIAQQIRDRGVRSPAILDAFRKIPREEFVPENLRGLAYDDGPLPIGLGQTISQPHVVALMLDLAEVAGKRRVLDVGTGSGYAAALMAQLAEQVFTIERHAPLLAQAQERFRRLKIRNVTTRLGDGALGWAEEAPFDAILVGAAANTAPTALLEQLAREGRLVLPAGGNTREQSLLRFTRLPDGGLRRENFGAVSFVPLVREAASERKGGAGEGV